MKVKSLLFVIALLFSVNVMAQYGDVIVYPPEQGPNGESGD